MQYRTNRLQKPTKKKYSLFELYKVMYVPDDRCWCFRKAMLSFYDNQGEIEIYAVRNTSALTEIPALFLLLFLLSIFSSAFHYTFIYLLLSSHLQIVLHVFLSVVLSVSPHTFATVFLSFFPFIHYIFRTFFVS